MKRGFILGVLLIIGVLILNCYRLFSEIKILEQDVVKYATNEKAFIAENQTLKNQNKVFSFTIEQLTYYNDSILEKMDSIRKELNIKNKDLKQIQFLLSSASKKDTIVFKDTIFKESVLSVDTIVKDEWHNTKVELRYPNTIFLTPSFISEKYIVVSEKKETINPPKKWWFLRLFQKKHTVLVVDIVEKNPYIETNKSRFIEIIK